jgi:hypothetical protein
MSTASISTQGNGRTIPFYDGPITAPVEIEGSGVQDIDEVTTATTIKRKFAVLKPFYRPANPATQVITDFYNPAAYLIKETVRDIRGGLVFYDRIFSTVPPNRIDERLVSFTLPGQCAPIVSNGYVSGWDKYGGGAPTTRRVLAQVQYYYEYNVDGISQDPANLFPQLSNPNILSAITYNGKVVDFVGQVFAKTGTQSLPGNKVQPLYTPQGYTVPPNLQAYLNQQWLDSVELKRWKGQIWELAMVYIPAGQVF